MERDRIGRQGDFFTSVSVGSLFGGLLAFQFSEWWRLAGAATTLLLVEAGAERGHLALDVLSCFRDRRPEILDRITYCILEPSSHRREWQAQALQAFPNRVHWAADFEELKSMGLFGRDFYAIIFSNELLDAFPVHRYGWNAAARTWFEWGVTKRDNRFVWSRNLPTAVEQHSTAPEIPPELAAVLPDGFTIESCPAATEWWSTAARFLESGKLLTFDYGLGRDELVRPELPNGTLRAFVRHQQSADTLADPGRQDITSDVNFSALESAGEAAGLRTETFSTQSQFLARLAARACQPRSGFGQWTEKETRQLQTLVHPNHLGERFKLLLQGRYTR